MSREAGDLGVLMVSLATSIVTQPLGDDLERHIAYARRVGHLHIVVYAPRKLGAEPLRPDDHLTLYPSASLSRYTFLWDAYRIGARLCRTARIDVISTQDPFTTGLAGVLLKRRFGTPLHVNNHSTYFGNRYWLAESPLRHRIFEWLGRRVVPRADTLRVCNSDQRERSIQMGLASECIEVIHVPVRLDHFAAPSDAAQVEALRHRLAIPPEGKVVLWVGRPVPTKRVPGLLDAFALLRREHPDAYLLLVGDLSQAAGLSAQASRLNVASWVRRPGVVRHEDLPTYYALGDVFALSSVYEGLPRVVVEAMAGGLPVVATRIPAVQEAVLDGETGLLCAPEDPADLARKLGALLSDRSRARELGQRGRALVQQRFGYERMMGDIVNLWARTAAMRERSI